MIRRPWLAPLLLLAVSGMARAQEERILSYHSDIAVQPDASMRVTETIAVHGAGKEIRHGIYRDFPTEYRDNLGNRVKVAFEILAVTRDGRSEPYHTEAMSNGARIYVGAKNVMLPPGDHTYTLTYGTRRQLGFFDDHDELYWNVTGNGWTFPIRQASAMVTLPTGVPREQIRVAAYTGAQGSRAAAVRSEIEPGPRVSFETTAALGPKEGLTIVVGWPKGYVAEPTRQEKVRDFLSDNRSTLVGLIGLGVVFLYYFVTWAKVGKDPATGTIMPIYDAPQGLSPSAIRYLVKTGFDDRGFASAVIDMAVKGYLTIKEDGSTYVLERTGADMKALAADEKIVANKLFGSDGKRVELTQSNQRSIKGAVDALSASLKASEEKVYFVTNSRYLGPGVVASILVVLAVGFSLERAQAVPVAAFMSLWLSIWSVGVFSLLNQVRVLWTSAAAGGIGMKAAAATMTMFSIPFVAGELFGIGMLAWATSVFTVLIFGALIFLGILFHYLLKAPTSAGRALLDKVEGFKMFLSAVEKDRLNVLNPLPHTPATFEKYLPYALALDVEQRWSERFSDVLAQAGRDGSTGYTPTWYSGGNWSTFGPSGFGSALGSAMTGAIASSASAGGSSSGFGGGGSSGGGGGGGGGGGW